VRTADNTEPEIATVTILSAAQAAAAWSRRFSSFRSRLGRQIAVWSEAGLVTAALLFFPFLVVLPRGIAALVSVAGLCAAGLMLSAGRTASGAILAGVATLLGALLLWGIASALWSIDPVRSLVVAIRLMGLFGVGLALVGSADLVAAPRRLMFVLLIGMALGIAMATIEVATDGGLSSFLSDRAFRPTKLNQASISFALLILPASAALVCLGRTISATLLAAATAATVFCLAGTAAKAVLVAGAAIGLLFYRMRPVVAAIALVTSIIIVLAAPLTFARLERLPGLGATADSIKISAGHRLLIWSFAGDRIAEHPLTGWGLDASRAMPGGGDPIRPGETWMPLHPHNAALQVWLELGAPGAALFAVLAAIFWGALARVEWPPLFAAAASASLTIAFIGCFATYGIWQEWWLGTLSFSLFLVLVIARVAGTAASTTKGGGAQPTIR
jgi:O-antigen ligase